MGTALDCYFSAGISEVLKEPYMEGNEMVLCWVKHWYSTMKTAAERVSYIEEMIREDVISASQARAIVTGEKKPRRVMPDWF
jgi:hypothetical protein